MTPDKAAWQRLAAEAVDGNPFFGVGLLLAAIDHLGGSKVRIASITAADGDLIGLAPLTPTRLGRAIPAISVWTHLHGPLGTPLFARSKLAEAVAGLIGMMDSTRAGRRILMFPYLPLEGAAANALRAAALAGGRPVAMVGAHHRAVVDRADGKPLSIRANLSSKKRRELDRQLRRLRESGRIEHQRLRQPDGARLKEALAAFFALEASGWKGRRGTALVKTERDRLFAEAAIAGTDGAVDLFRLDDRPIAALVSFASGDQAVTWKIAYDEDLARFSPGVQIMLDGTDGLLADPAIRHVDSLAVADHPMVDHLFPGRMAIGTLLIGPRGGGMRFRLGVRLAELEISARAYLRKNLRR